MTRTATRRRFLQAMPLAAAGFSLVDAKSLGEESKGGFQVFRAEAMTACLQTLAAKPGNNALVTEKSFLVVMTVEKAKRAREFEWHEARDHVVQILDGETTYEIGGVPRDGRFTKPGEWLAPESVGAVTLVLKKGDMLTLSRGTPHKRSTTDSVAFLLISAQ